MADVQPEATARHHDASEVVTADPGEAQELYQARGWTDGLPVTPPTRELVDRFLDEVGFEARDVVAVEPVRQRPLSAEKLAVNAVMAGCVPAAFPVVVAAIRAMCREEYLLHGSSASTGGSAPLLIVNGPIRTRLGMNSGYNALANASRANATIGRAVRLVLLNLLDFVPGRYDRSALGHPGKFTFCVAEDEESSDWVPLARERLPGLADTASAVTVVACSSPHIVMNEWTRDPEEVLEAFAASIRANMLTYSIWSGDYTLVLGGQLRDTLTAAGWTKQDVRRYVAGSARVTRGQWREVGKGALVDEDNRDREYRALDHPDDLLVVAAGGPANGFGAVIPPWYGKKSRAVTVPIEEPTR